MKLNEILKQSNYDDAIFSNNERQWLENRIVEREGKKGVELKVQCIVRNKEVKLTPEETIRQLYAYKLVTEYNYPIKQLRFEFPIYFGREAKRADIVVLDKDDSHTAYIIVEIKKLKAKDGKEQLKSYCHGTGAPMAIWTNGENIAYYHRKNPNYFEDIPAIPKAIETLEDILNLPFTMNDLVLNDKLKITGKSLKHLILEMEDEVLANAGVDVFEEVFKLIFAKLYDEKQSGNEPERSTRNLEFRNRGGSANQLKDKIQHLFDKANEEWSGVFDENAKINLTPTHLEICVSSLEGVKLFNSNLEIVDEAFEYLMSKSSKGEKGQYFTPRYVIDMCVRMLNPKPEEAVIDTAAGSSGFTVHSIFHVWRNILHKHQQPISHLFTAENKPRECEEYVQQKVFAIDFDEKAVRVSRTLNLIAGDGQTNVLHLNTLDYARWEQTTKQEEWIDTYNEGFKKLKKLQTVKGDYSRFNFDVLMANPPFAGDIKEGQILNRYELANKNGKSQSAVGRDILFIERNLNFLKPGGRMAVVLPQGRFNNGSDKYIREFIAEHCRILAVVGLHGNTFKPHTGTKTSVLFVQKWNDNAEIGPLCSYKEDYPIFFATQKMSAKDTSGELLYWSASVKDFFDKKHDPTRIYTVRSGEALTDLHFHPIVAHDLFHPGRFEYYDGIVEEEHPYGVMGIAEAFTEFAKKEGLSFF